MCVLKVFEFGVRRKMGFEFDAIQKKISLAVEQSQLSSENKY